MRENETTKNFARSQLQEHCHEPARSQAPSSDLLILRTRIRVDVSSLRPQLPGSHMYGHVAIIQNNKMGDLRNHYHKALIP